MSYVALSPSLTKELSVNLTLSLTPVNPKSFSFLAKPMLQKGKNGCQEGAQSRK